MLCPSIVRRVSYVLPFRSSVPATRELIDYLEWLGSRAEVIWVDGSSGELFAANDRPLGRRIVHVAPDEDTKRFANGKVAGVLTGVRRASHDALVIADDDVRYDAAALDAVASALDEADVVRPQNYFDPLPWHARLDTARTLINRVTGGDWPGTLGVRRRRLIESGGYDGDVLFENLELVRTVVASGGRESVRFDVFVRRAPPSTAHFLSQRVRQAYDEFARPARLAIWLGVLPMTAMLAARRPRLLGAASVAAIAAAECGRRRAGATRVFPASAALLAPIWILERGVCAWLAVAARLALGGVPYHGRILSRAANPIGALRRRRVDLTGQMTPVHAHGRIAANT